MNSTQGVILLMGSALALYLLWNAHSPFNAPTTIRGNKLPITPPANLIPGAGDTPTITPDPHFPVIPAEILGPYTDCITQGGHWDMKANKCIWNG